MAKSHTSLLASLIALPLAIGLYGEGTALAQPGPVAQGSSRPIEFPAACSEVKPEAADEARKTFIAGKNKADESSYGEAVTLLVAAYKKDCSRHAFLQIIASVLEKQGKYEDAIAALTLVLERQALTGAERSPIETKIKNLRGLVEEKKKERDAAAAAAASAAARNDTAPPANNVIVREHGIAPWIVTGAGAVVLVAGIVMTAAFDVPAGCEPIRAGDPRIGTPRNSSEPNGPKFEVGNSACTTTAESQDAARAETLNGVGIGAAIGGGVLVATGLIWHFLEPTGPAAASARLPRIVPSMAPGYGGLTLSGAF